MQHLYGASVWVCGGAGRKQIHVGNVSAFLESHNWDIAGWQSYKGANKCKHFC